MKFVKPEYFFFLFLAVVPFEVMCSGNALLPNGPIHEPLKLKMYKPKPLKAVSVAEVQPLKRHAAPTKLSAQQFESQMESPAVTEEMESVGGAILSHQASSKDQAKLGVPQYGYPVGSGVPVPPTQLNIMEKRLFVMPPWLMQIAKSAAGLSAALSSIGLPGVANINVCEKAPVIKETMLCIQNALEELKSVYMTAKEVVTLNARVMSGGRTADAALQRLKTLSSRPFGKLLMKFLGTTMVTQMLMQRESTPDRQRWQAGSLITLITDLPVASVIADSQTGSFGHINVVLPRPSRIRRADKEIKMLDEGVDPIDLTSGPMTGLEGRGGTNL